MAPNREKQALAATRINSSPLSFLDSTVGSFADRINRGLKEKEQKQGEAHRAKGERHAAMLKEMTTIRKALQETSRITLGERFGFDVDVSDWEGWPRVELNLHDRLAPTWTDLGMVVTANDHKELGTIRIGLKSGEILGKVELASPAESERLPFILKRAVRQFLDIVGAYVLDPVKPEDLLDEETRPLEVEELDELAAELAKAEVFSEQEHDYSPSANSVSEEEESSDAASLLALK
ncbi:MAG: hypothetical protein K1X83_09540 [Oligoflexia bacterium]|nr:hypothetical protein [Oligoflexia bacterium]